MIYVTGDIHASVDIGKLSTKKFPEQKTLSKNGFSGIIILTDKSQINLSHCITTLFQSNKFFDKTQI